MNCEQFQSQISSWLDDELNDSESEILRQHVDSCSDCREFRSELRGVNDLLQLDTDKHRQQADSLADLIISQLPETESRVEPATPGPHRLRDLLYLLVGLAAGFLCAWGLFKTNGETNPSRQTVKNTAPSVGDSTHDELTDPQVLPEFVAKLVSVIGNVSVGSKVDVALTQVPPASPYSCVAESIVQTGPDSRCELILSSGSVVRLNSGTKLVVRSPHEVEIHAGQLFCNAAEDCELNVIAAKGTDSRSNLSTFTCPSNSVMCTSSSPKGLQVSSAAGEIAVKTSNSELKLKSGESVEVIAGAIQPVSNIFEDPLLSTRWIHPLLIQKGANDAELKSRVDAMLAQIGRTKLSSLYESEIRSLGEHCVLPLIRYLESPQSQEDPSKRHVAARIIADLATTWAIGDLIGLLESEDGEVRRQVAVALQRLTGQTHGATPEQWNESPQAETRKLWQSWWRQNHRLYPSLDDLQKRAVNQSTL